ncbi:MAG TPA: hypothetical protein PKE51_09680, partial [Gemmatimonadaceae bacterium]|nr:hypothetical protein [Gemmatimonadaceae bacterium]
MISTIARKEAVELWRDGRFRWGAALVVTLLAVALLSGGQHSREIEASHTAATEATWQRWLSQGE